LSEGKDELISAMEQFESLHKKHLSKVDRRLLIDLLLRLRENPDSKPIYDIETFVEKGANTEEIRNEIIRKTEMAPQFFDKGTHIVVHHELDYDLLKHINDRPGVVEIKGTYMGSMASMGASQEASADIRRAEGY
jgi:transcriptional regulator of NAD metabolism